MGFFDSWHVSGVTTEAAKTSAIFHVMGGFVLGVNYDPEFNNWSREELYRDTLNDLAKSATIFIGFSKHFDSYFNKGNKKQKDSAIKFLVIFSSYCMAKDNLDWDWQQVRHLSQGLYESMEKSPAHFLHYNTPLIEDAIRDVNEFINKYNHDLIPFKY